MKKNPLQILAEYEKIKRNVGESIQDYCVRLNAVYNEIPDHLKPPMGIAMMKFPDGFDANMAYQLRERENQPQWKTCRKSRLALKQICYPRELERKQKRKSLLRKCLLQWINYLKRYSRCLKGLSSTNLSQKLEILTSVANNNHSIE